MNSQSLLKGSIIKGIIIFSIPLLISNILQQLYNTVDSIVVGNYLGDIALAAIGVTTPILNLVIGLFVGISAGASILVAQRFGEDNNKMVGKTIINIIFIGIVMSIIFTIAGVIFSYYLLDLMNTPKEIISEANQYLTMYSLGISFSIMYNVIAGILRSLGNSKSPLYYLMISSILHIFLDYLFVKVIPLGIVGPAISTNIAQAICTILAMYKLYINYPQYWFGLTWKSISRIQISKILTLALPTGFQQAVGQISNIMIQTYINRFSTTIIAGYSTAIKIDGFSVLPLLVLNMSITTFVAQNMGAKNYIRIKKGVKYSLILALTLITIISLFILMKGNWLLSFFNNNTEVIYAGRTVQLIFIPFYLFLPFVQILSGALRGRGISLLPMIVIISNFLILRQLFLVINYSYFKSVESIYFSQPLSWITCALMMIVLYIKNVKKEDNK